MDDLFGFERERYDAPRGPAPDPHEAGGVAGCRPWPGCDIKSEVWRAYTEGYALVRGSARHSNLPEVLRGVEKHRGALGRKYLDRTIAIVRRDLAGEIFPRENIGSMIAALPEQLRSEAMRADLKKRGQETHGTRKRR